MTLVLDLSLPCLGLVSFFCVASLLALVVLFRFIPFRFILLCFVFDTLRFTFLALFRGCALRFVLFRFAAASNQVVYEFLVRFVVSSEVDAKQAKQYVDQSLCLQLVELFDR